jgi:hypothetical protein
MEFYLSKGCLEEYKNRLSLFNKASYNESSLDNKTIIKCTDPLPIVKVLSVIEIDSNEFNRFALKLFDGIGTLRVVVDQSLHANINNTSNSIRKQLFDNVIIIIKNFTFEEYQKEGKNIKVLSLLEYSSIGIENNSMPILSVNDTSSNRPHTIINSLAVGQKNVSIECDCIEVGDVVSFQTESNKLGSRQRFLLKDKTKTYVELVAFHEQVTELKLVKGFSYRLTNPLIKRSNDKFKVWKCYSNKNNIEFQLDQDTKIVEMEPNFFKSSESPKLKDKFTDLNELVSCRIGSLVHVIGVLIDIGELDVQKFNDKSDGFKYKNASSLNIRRIQILDHTNTSVMISVWGKEADDFDHQVGTILSFDSLKLTNFNNISLSVLKCSSICNVTNNIKSERIKQIKSFWEVYKSGNNETTNNLSTYIKPNKRKISSSQNFYSKKTKNN